MEYYDVNLLSSLLLKDVSLQQPRPGGSDNVFIVKIALQQTEELVTTFSHLTFTHAGFPTCVKTKITVYKCYSAKVAKWQL